MRLAREKQMQDLKTQSQEGDKARGMKRMKFLLKQAEIFQHFMEPGAGKSTGSKKGKKKSKSHRAEHAEEEEDELLLKDEADLRARPRHGRAVE